MKQLIVLAASIILGVFLCRLIAGPQENSLYSELRRVWQTETEIHAGIQP